MVMGNRAATSHGACMVIPAPGFALVATMEAVQAERRTSPYGVLAMFIAGLPAPGFADHDLSGLRTGIWTLGADHRPVQPAHQPSRPSPPTCANPHIKADL